jgi:hypothetical protein
MSLRSTINSFLENYLMNSFKPAVIFRLAEKLHIPVEKDELPQRTAFQNCCYGPAVQEQGRGADYCGEDSVRS